MLLHLLGCYTRSGAGALLNQAVRHRLLHHLLLITLTGSNRVAVLLLMVDMLWCVMARTLAARLVVEIHVASSQLRLRPLLCRHIGSALYLLGANQMGVWRLARLLIVLVLRNDLLLFSH